MTDTDKLKRLKKEIKRKEFWRETRDSRDYVIDEICDAYDYGAEERYVYSYWLREAILALIAENERFRDRQLILDELGRERGLQVMREATRAKIAEGQRDEAVALLREASALHKDMHEVISDFLARIDADNKPVA